MDLRPIIIAVVSFLFIASPVLANGVELTLPTTSIVGYGGETSSIDLTIKNNLIVPDTFTITIFPPSYLNVTTNLEKSSVWVNASSTQSIKLYFDMPMDVEEMMLPFKISVKSATDGSISDEQDFLLRTVRKTDVYIDKINPPENSRYDPEQVVNIEVKVRNVGVNTLGKFDIETTVSKSGSVLKTYDYTIGTILPKSFEMVYDNYTIGKYDEPGIYVIQSTLGNSEGKIISSKITTFNVSAAYKLPSEYTTRNSLYTFLFITTTITVKNEGNINTPSFYINESIPWIGKVLFSPQIEPNSISKSADGRTVYSWLIPTLDPGKQITIKYSYGLWKIWLTILVVGGGIYIGIKFFYSPTIIKTHRHRGPITKEKEMMVSLDVKNRSRHEVKDVQVRDIVPSIAKVVEKFDTLKPIMRQTSVGTEMRWKIDVLKPGEERLITYRIKPVVDVAEKIDLPKAHARYVDRKKMKRIIASKSVLIKG
jgi:hypothetical protein